MSWSTRRPRLVCRPTPKLARHSRFVARPTFPYLKARVGQGLDGWALVSDGVQGCDNALTSVYVCGRVRARVHVCYVSHVNECAYACATCRMYCIIVWMAQLRIMVVRPRTNERTNERRFVSEKCCESDTFKGTLQIMQCRDMPRGNISDRKYFFAGRPDRWKESAPEGQCVTLAGIIPST